MIRRPDGKRQRRGMSVVECAIVYPFTILLLLSTVILGLGVFRFQQLQFLAREGARYASVHGPNYSTATGNAVASSTTVQSYLNGLAVGLNGFQCQSFTYPSTLPGTVTITLTYTWKPEAFYPQVSWTASSTMPVTY
jgi:hypothetical protein